MKMSRNAEAAVNVKLLNYQFDKFPISKQQRRNCSIEGWAGLGNSHPKSVLLDNSYQGGEGFYHLPARAGNGGGGISPRNRRILPLGFCEASLSLCFILKF